MAEPASVELQKAIFAALIADKSITAAIGMIAIGGKNVPAIFDKVPQEIIDQITTGTYPTYATIGDGTETFELFDSTDEEDDAELTTHTLAIAVYSQAIGLIEAKNIAHLIRKSLSSAFRAGTLALATNEIKSFDSARVEYSRLEGFVNYAALQMRVLTSPK